MVLVFDMDDTLYDESTYMKSGFRAVSEHLAANFEIDGTKAFDILLNVESKSGRGKVFDVALAELKIFSRRRVRECISVYRLHNPSIELNEDAVRCLNRFSHLPLYVVTDGNKIVQRKKVASLNLLSKVKRAFVTHQYGRAAAKPSPYCFERIARIEGTPPEKIFYIADNPHKDFVGIRPKGFRTIRIRQGMFKNDEGTEQQKAEYEISTLDALDEHFFAMTLQRE
jgi:putative hydrolase of the HAD superfamily